MIMRDELALLQERICELELQNSLLKTELAFLKTHPTIAKGIKGETLVAKMLDASVSGYAESYDVSTSSGQRIEVKYSKLNQPMKASPTQRWNWSKPLGWRDKGKDAHFLLLIGEKDSRYLNDYPDTTPYIYFLVPMTEVQSVMNKGSKGRSEAVL